MTNQQAAQYDAIQAVRAYLTTHAAVVNAMPAFKVARDTFFQQADALTAALVQQDTDSTGVTASKADARAALIRQVMPLSAATCAFAQATNNDVLKGQAQVTASQLRDMSDDALSGRAQRVLDAALQVEGQLGTYGIDTSAVEEAYEALTIWRTRQGSVREAIAEGSKGTAALGRLLPQVQAHLTETIDRLVAVVGASNPAFADGYATARAIVGPSAGTRSLTLTASEVRNGAPVPVANATATINPGNLVKTTSDAGSFYVQGLAPGTYTVSLAKPGYQLPAPVSFTVAAGEMTTLGITLTKA